MNKYPNLTSYRFMNPKDPQFASARAELASGQMLNEIDRCCQYLATKRKIKKPHMRGHSYYLKHDVEQWQRDNNLQYIYISEGAAIAAGIIMGFCWKEGPTGKVRFAIGAR